MSGYGDIRVRSEQKKHDRRLIGTVKNGIDISGENVRILRVHRRVDCSLK